MNQLEIDGSWVADISGGMCGLPAVLTGYRCNVVHNVFDIILPQAREDGQGKDPFVSGCGVWQVVWRIVEVIPIPRVHMQRKEVNTGSDPGILKEITKPVAVNPQLIEIELDYVEVPCGLHLRADHGCSDCLD